MEFEAYADLAKMGAHLDVAAEQTSFITHDGLDAKSVTISKTVHVLLTNCEGEAPSLVSVVPRRFGLEAWRKSMRANVENRTAGLLRGIFNPRARREKMHIEGRDFGDMLASWEKDVAQYRIAAGADLQQAVHVATVMEHTPPAYRDLLKVGFFDKS